MFGSRALWTLPLYLLPLLVSPALAGGPIASGVTTAGSLSGPSYLESWTFDAAAGERIVATAVTTGGAVNTTITVRAPGGAIITTTSADRIDVLLTLSGTHTIEITDQGLNDAGTYNLTWMNLTSGPYTHAGDLDGGAIGSGDVVAAGIGAVTDLDAFTFTGTAGDRVLFGVIEGAGAPFNVQLTLYPPGGGASEASTGGGNKIDAQLAASGTYTVLVEDVGDDHTGSYTVSLLNLSGGPHTTPADLDGGAIASSTTASGTMNGVIDWDVYSFSATAGDRVAVVALTTSGTLNTTSYLYPPNGGPPLIGTAVDRWDVQLTQTGTWWIVVEDQQFGNTGTYTVALLNLTAGPLTNGGDLDGDAIASGDVVGGTLTVADLDAFTFSGTAGERVLFGVIEGAASPFNVQLTLYPPGGFAAEASTGGGNKIDAQLAATGTYTVVVEDIGDDHAGGYTVSYLNVSSGPHATLADPDGGAIASATSTTGTIDGVIDWDAYTFSGTAGDRVAVVALTTGGTLNTTTYLYPPNGGPPLIASAGDRWDVKLTQTGTWTIVVEDQSFGNTGTYRLSMLNLTSGPLTTVGDPDGGAIASGEVRAGTMDEPTDLDAFTFPGAAGERVLFGVIEGTASPFNVTLTLYPPGGDAPVASTGGGNRIDVQLAATGTYVAVVEDVGNDHTGAYTVSHLNVTGGPLTTLADPDGGAFPSATHATGTIDGVIDWDAFTIDGSIGDRIVVVDLATSGSLNTVAYLYPPNGGPAQVSTAVDRWDFQLTQTGTHTVVIEDQNFGNSGDYSMTWLNLTSGPLTHPGDLDGGPIGSDEHRAGSIGIVPDLDAYTFTGTAGDRVVVAGVATTAAPFNTAMTLYPPGGGAAVQSSSGGDRMDYQLAATGTFTILVDDVANDHTGNYGLTYVNLTAGPVTGADPDGGWLISGGSHNGEISPVPDLDVYWFTAEPGDTAKISCVTTSGPLNTTTYLYPPGGGGPVFNSTIDVWEHALSASGRYALLVQHVDLTQTGMYLLGLTGPLTNLDVPGDRPTVPTRLALSLARPNPSRGAAVFTLDLPRRTAVEMRIFDARGALVRVLEDRILDPGTRAMTWDGLDGRGRRVPGGIYFARVAAGGETVTRRVVRME